jgi:hypothetical protein
MSDEDLFLSNYSGAYVGFTYEGDFYDKLGGHVGRIQSNEIYDRKGRYIGEIKQHDRICVCLAKKDKTSLGFQPGLRLAPTHLSPGNLPKLSLPNNYEDFNFEQ